MTSWKKQVRAHGVPPGYGIQHPREILRDNVGKLPWAAGTGTTCQDSSNEAKCRSRREPNGSGTLARRSDDERGNALGGDGTHIPNGGNTEVGQGAQDTWRRPRLYGGRLDKTGATPRRCQEARLEANQRGGGVYGPAFKPLQAWEGLRKKQGFKPDPGNLAVRDYRGASGNVSHGGTVNPSCDRKSRNGNPRLQRGAPDFYPSGLSTACGRAAINLSVAGAQH